MANGDITRKIVEMSVVAEAVYNAFQPEKLNYELLGAGKGLPRKTGDTPNFGPVWQLGKEELLAEKYLPSAEELEDLKSKLTIELDLITSNVGYSMIRHPLSSAVSLHQE